MTKPLNAKKPLVVDDPDPGFAMIQGNGMVAGQTISQWIADWWRWELSMPAANLADPSWDASGAWEAGQPVSGLFFLAGAWANSGLSERIIGDAQHPAIGHDTPILIPVLNTIVSQWPTDPKNTNVQALQDFKQGVTDVFLKIDGKDIRNLQSDLVRNDRFAPGPVTPDSVLPLLANPDTGEIGQLGTNGYWAVAKLSAGTHTIEFGGSGTGFSVHVKDTITVG